jgi:hypothetical protein
MVDLKSVPANLDDLRMWGRSIRSYKGAVGAGMFEPPEPMIGGGLDALIPLHNAEWLTRFDIWFEMNDDVLRKTTVRKTGIGFSNTKTIPEVFLLVDKLFHAEWPLLSFEEAMRK